MAALDREPRMRGVLCLFEGVVAGAADGYARMAGKPAATLLHLGPGFANAISFLHNARKAGQPVVNIVGDHATSHSQYAQAPLTSDIMAICGSVSDWLHQSQSARPRWRAMAPARCRRRGAGQIATLVLPADCAWSEAAAPAPRLAGDRSPGSRSAAAIEQVAAALKNGKKTALLLRGRCLERAGRGSGGPHRGNRPARGCCMTISPRA